MVVFANTIPASSTDGIPYATGMVVPAAENDLFNQTNAQGPFPDPVHLQYEQAVMAVVVLTAQNGPLTNTTYVVLQTDLGDGVWIDVAWCLWTGIAGSATFVLMGGANGCNAFQQARAVGTAPGSTGCVQSSLGGRFRFVGKSTITGGTGSSSSGPGTPQVTATIRFRRFDNPGSAA